MLEFISKVKSPNIGLSRKGLLGEKALRNGNIVIWKARNRLSYMRCLQFLERFCNHVNIAYIKSKNQNKYTKTSMLPLTSKVSLGNSVLSGKGLIEEKALRKGNIVLWNAMNSLLYIFCLLEKKCCNTLNMINSNLRNYSVNCNAVLAPNYNFGYKLPNYRGIPKAKKTKNIIVFSHKITLGSLAIKPNVVNNDKKYTFYDHLALSFLLLLSNNLQKIPAKKGWFFGDKLQLIGNNNLNYTPKRFYPGGGDKKVIAELVNLGKNAAGTTSPSNVTASKQQLISGTPQPAEVTNAEKEFIITPQKPDEIKSEKASITLSDNQEISGSIKTFYDPLQSVLNPMGQDNLNDGPESISLPIFLPPREIIQNIKISEARKYILEVLAKAGLPEKCRLSLTAEARAKALEEATKQCFAETSNTVNNEEKLTPINSPLQVEGIEKKQTIDAIEKVKQTEIAENLAFLGVGNIPKFEEHYRHLLATIQTLQKYPEEASAIGLLQIYGRLWANLNIQALQAASKPLIEAKNLKKTLDFLKYVKKPEKYEKELSKILITEPNTIDEVMALTKFPLAVDLRYCNAEKKEKILEIIKNKFGTNFRNNTNNENPDSIVISNDKALALDIKRFSNNFTSLVFDEIHVVPEEALLTKTQLAVSKICTKLENNSNYSNNVPTKLQKKLLEAKEKELKRTLTLEEKDAICEKNKTPLNAEEEKLKEVILLEFIALQKKLEKNPTNDVLAQYNELILKHLTFFDRLQIRITILLTVNYADFNLPACIVYEHKKNYDSAENITKVNQLLDAHEKDTQQKALTYTTKPIILGVIEYAKNPDDK
jgi:hypothetical protein